MLIIGIDSAVQDANIGLALCEYKGGNASFLNMRNSKKDSIDLIKGWISQGEQCLLAIDSPLGWPVAFGSSVALHKAGEYLGNDDKEFFKRYTDLDIYKRFGKMPLEVAANLIARTAFFTLKRIEEIREKSDRDLRMLWSPSDNFDIGFIEVYPASILLANKCSIAGYRQDSGKRKAIEENLKKIYGYSNRLEIDFSVTEHNFDAFICCLGGIDFIDGKAMACSNVDEKILKEGWIWTK